MANGVQQNKRENAFVFQRQRRTPRKRNNNDPLYLLALNDFMDVLVVSGAALEASFDPVVAAWLCEPVRFIPFLSFMFTYDSAGAWH